jgi:hypothetical protein
VVDDSSANTSTAGAAAGGAAGKTGTTGATSGGSQHVIHTASASLVPVAGDTVAGTVKFDDASGVIGFDAAFQSCPTDERSYGFAIYDGTNCSNPSALKEWTRNNNNIVDCRESSLGHNLEVVLKSEEDWSIGGAADSNIVGRLGVIFTVDSHGDSTVIACGVITSP